MSHIKVKGFVIREVPVGETDRIISILTADLGLISASVRGARRTRSSLLMSTQVFSLSEFELFLHKGHYTVNSAELTEPFLALHQNLDRLVCAAHLAEIAVDSMCNDIAQPQLYRLWAFTMQALQIMPDPLFIVHIAQLRLLAEIGFAPHLESCVSCGAPGGSKPLFSVSACGLICPSAVCRQKVPDAMPISEGILNAMKYTLNTPYQRLFNFQLSPENRLVFMRLSARYLTQQMEKSYTRLQILDGLEPQPD